MLSESLYETILLGFGFFFHLLVLINYDHPNIHDEQRSNRPDCGSGPKSNQRPKSGGS